MIEERNNENSKIGQFLKIIEDIRVYLQEVHRRKHNIEEIMGIGKILSKNYVNFLTDQILQEYWNEIAVSYSQNPKICVENVNLLIRSYRSAGNLFDVINERLPEIFSQLQYIQLIVTSLLKSISQMSSTHRASLGFIIKEMNLEAIRSIGWTMCVNNQKHQQLFIDILHFPTLLETVLTLQRIPLISKSSENVNSIYTVVGLLLQRMNDLTAPPTTAPHSLQFPLNTNSRIQFYLPFLTQKSSTPRMGRIISQNILDVDVPLACYRVGLLWSERVYLNQGNLEAQSYTTSLILGFLSRLNKDDLLLPPEHNSMNDNGNDSSNEEMNLEYSSSYQQSLLSILSRGVSAHLDSPTSLTRINGMRVAEKLSEVMTSTNAIHFEELKRYREDEEGNIILIEKNDHIAPDLIPSKEKDSSQTNERMLKEITQDNDPKSERDGESDNDSDSDEEFQSYFMKEKLEVITNQDEEQRKELIEQKLIEIENKEESIPLVRYLRECLASTSLLPLFLNPSLLLDPSDFIELQFTDSSNPDGLYVNHKTALLSIPRIVQKKPADGRDLAAPLMKELLRLSNSFNMEKFDDLRTKACESLLFAYPKEVTSIITWAVTSETMTLGSRLEVLTLMVRGAYHLSGMTPERQTSSNNSTNTQLQQQRQQPIPIQAREADTLTYQQPATNSNSNLNSKTIIKRPLRLASLKQPTKYFRNHFPICAEQFFSVVFNSLNNSLLELFSTPDTTSTSTDPGIHILFPSQSLLALGAFSRCVINTSLQKKFVLILLPFVFQLRDLPSLHLRRAVMIVLFDSLQSIFEYLNSHQQNQFQIIQKHEQMFGTLDYALNIFHDGGGGGGGAGEGSWGGGGGGGSDSFLPSIVIEIVNWVSQRIHEEADHECRVFQLEILRLALAFLERSSSSSL